MDADDIEASLTVPAEMANRMLAEKEAQDFDRGAWPSPRDARQPNAPWPSRESAALEYLLWKAKGSLDAGMDPQQAFVQLAVHAWFEGGVENYDRGQRDARKPRPVD